MSYLLVNGDRLVVSGNPLSIDPSYQPSIPKVVVAKETVSFEAVGITEENTHIIYEVAATLKSYVPGRLINGITGFEEQKGYYWVTKTNFTTTSVVPPL